MVITQVPLELRAELHSLEKNRAVFCKDGMFSGFLQQQFATDVENASTRPPPNYPSRYPQHNPTGASRPLRELHWRLPVVALLSISPAAPLVVLEVHHLAVKLYDSGPGRETEQGQSHWEAE